MTSRNGTEPRLKGLISGMIKATSILLVLSILLFSFGIKGHPYPTVENSIAVNAFNYLRQDLLPASAISIANPTGAALVQMQISLFLALIAGFPVILYHLLKFLLPMAQERRTFFSILISSSILFLLGAAFSYFAVLPLVMKFLYAPIGALALIDAMAFLSIAMGLVIISGFIFTASSMMLFLKYGGVFYRFWMGNRMYMLLVFAVIGIAGFAVAQSAGIYTDVIKNRAGTLTYNVPNASGTLAVMPNFTRFTANGTWDKPSNVTVVMIEVIGAGGGGGGARGNGQGGGGDGGAGGGGALARGIYNAVDLPATLTITVGTGGAGGDGAAGSNGAAGTAGGNSNVSGANFTLMAYGGGLGEKGSAAQHAGGGGGGGTGGAGVAGGTSGEAAAGGNPTIQGSAQGNSTGGRGGGGAGETGSPASAGNAEFGGGGGGRALSAPGGSSLYGAGGGGGRAGAGGAWGSYTTGGGGTAGTGSGGAGGNGTSRNYGAGDGGGGGAAGTGGAGGNGGAGGAPGGGGGAGVGNDGNFVGGNGGAGGRGEVRIWAW